MDARERRAIERWRPVDTVAYRALTALVVATSKVVMRRLNRLEIEGLERFQALRDRGDRGLLTFSNHVSYFDDPLIISCLGVERFEEVRWVAADAINFFGNPVKAWIYSGGKCVPVVRGAGLEQPGFAFLVERLSQGAWVHVFPEGGRTRDPNALLRHPFKQGLGRLVAEARPLLLPFYHYGMQDVLARGARRIGRGHTVRVRFGEPVDADADFIVKHADRPGTLTGPDLWAEIAEWGYRQLSALQAEVHPLAG